MKKEFDNMGNAFWNMRSKVNFDKLQENSQLLWLAACEYFAWCDENPILESDIKGADLVEVTLPKVRAYTIQGLAFYLGTSATSLKSLKSRLEKENKTDSPLLQVLEDIDQVIYTQKFTNAAAGMLNPGIITRELGLSDKSETKVVMEQPLFGDEESE